MGFDPQIFGGAEIVKTTFSHGLTPMKHGSENHSTRRTATCNERAAFAEALLVAGEQLRQNSPPPNSQNFVNSVQTSSEPPANASPVAATHPERGEVMQSSVAALAPAATPVSEVRQNSHNSENSVQVPVLGSPLTHVVCSWCSTVLQGDPATVAKPGASVTHGTCPACQVKHDAQRQKLTLLGGMARGHREQAAKLRAIGDYGLAEMEEKFARNITNEAAALSK